MGNRGDRGSVGAVDGARRSHRPGDGGLPAAGAGDAKIINNSTHLGAAGLLPNITISSGYNGSINLVRLCANE